MKVDISHARHIGQVINIENATMRDLALMGDSQRDEAVDQLLPLLRELLATSAKEGRLTNEAAQRLQLPLESIKTATATERPGLLKTFLTELKGYFGPTVDIIMSAVKLATVLGVK